MASVVVEVVAHHPVVLGTPPTEDEDHRGRNPR